MAKGSKTSKRQLSVDDALRAHGELDVRQLIALIHRVNPSGENLPEKQTALRYSQKNQLQSLLVRRFGADLEIQPEPNNPTVVSLYHRPTGLEACHAVIAALDDDARSWVQREVDLLAFRDAEPTAETNRPGSRWQAAEDLATSTEDLPVHELIRKGREAMDGYDYELAHQVLMTAFDRSEGSAGAAVALLTLLVDAMAADDDALLLAERMAADAQSESEVRLLLGIAAARLGRRDEALSWLRNHPSPRAADALIALARQALASNDWSGAISDLQAAKACAPTHPDLNDIAQRIASCQALERRPLEQELVQLVEAKLLQEATQKARALLRRFPDSDVAQRALRDIDRQQQREQQRRWVAEADEAMERQELVLALSLLKQAALVGVDDDLRIVYDKIAHLEAMARERRDQAEIERLVGILSAGKESEGLLAYAASDAKVRDAVRQQVSLRQLGWLDEAGVQGTGARARAGVAAVMALARASETVASDPEGARQGLAMHAKVLQGIRYAAEVRERAESSIANQRLTVAVSKIDAATDLMEEMKLLEARNLLKEINVRDLDPKEQTIIRTMIREVEALLEQQRRRSLLSDLLKEGHTLQARDVAVELFEHAPERLKPKWAAKVKDIKARIREVYGIRLYDAQEVGPLSLWDFNVFAIQEDNGILRTLMPDGRAILAESHDFWVFLRILNVHNGEIEQLVVVRTPMSLGLLRSQVFGDTLILIGGCGDVLELSTMDWDVMRFYTLIALPENKVETAGDLQNEAEGVFKSDASTDVIIDIRLTQDCRFFWIFQRRSLRYFIDIVDRQQRKVVRRLPMTTLQTVVWPVPFANPPRVVVTQDEPTRFTVYDPSGVLVSTSDVEPNHPHSLVALSGGRDYFLFTKDADGRTGWTEVSEAGTMEQPRIHVLEGFSGGKDVRAAANVMVGRVYLQSTHHSGHDSGKTSLVGLEKTEAGVRLMFHVVIPDRTLLLEAPTGSVVALCVHDDGIELVPLGREAPVFRESASAQVGRLPQAYLTAAYTECRKPAGAQAEAVQSMKAVLQKDPPGRNLIRIREAKDEGDVPKLFYLCLAIHELGFVLEAVALGEWIVRHHPDHPEVRMSKAGGMTDNRQWAQVLDCLSPVDPAVLPESTARHYHHLLGTALLQLGQVVEARAVLLRGEAYQGACDLGELLALAMPLGEPDEQKTRWTKEQVVVRLLASAVARADQCLLAGDSKGAAEAMDSLIVWEANEVQSLARRARAQLEVESVGVVETIRKAIALASFREAHGDTTLLVRREAAFPSGKWPQKELDALADKADAWLEANFGGPFSLEVETASED